jgi:hypothetical protein
MIAKETLSPERFACLFIEHYRIPIVDLLKLSQTAISNSGVILGSFSIKLLQSINSSIPYTIPRFIRW